MGTVKEISKQSNFLSKENFYNFTDRKKIVVFVPKKFADKILIKLSETGAGVIGNYTMCSFRTNGTGSFKPNEKAKPFSGKSNLLSYESEICFEMEFENHLVNKVVDALLAIHPYDEPAYEIYDFRKRDKNIIGTIINFKQSITLGDLIKTLFKKVGEHVSFEKEIRVKRIAIISTDVTEQIIQSAKFARCDAVIRDLKNNLKIYKTYK